jgi:YidC/Oxa1 family membrane protein insertase
MLDLDKNTIIGFILIAAILIGFGIYNAPTEAEKLAQQRALDSLAQIEKNKNTSQQNTKAQPAIIDTSASDSLINDSIALTQNIQKYGSLAPFAQGEKNYYTIENDYLVAKFTNKGARIVSVLLKKYKTWDKKELYLLDEDSSRFNLQLNIENKLVNTEDLFFTTEIKNKQLSINSTDSAAITFKLPINPDKYLAVTYSLKGDQYVITTQVNFVGLENVLTKNTITLNYEVNLPSHEKNLTGERAATTIYYNTKSEGVDYLSETSDDKEILAKNDIQWFSFKSQFFTSSVILDNVPVTEAVFQTQTSASTKYVKKTTVQLQFSLPNKSINNISWRYYFGPNHYNTLKKFNIDLEKQVPLGWGIFGWVNRFIVIPVFNFFGGFGWNYGLVILCLTLVFKIILSPLTYKAYLSAAKMRVLKPELDEINKRYENGDPLKKQQEIMTLYRTAGVNPMGGCLPMLLQLPILIALFRFFPASIELRQQSFLWADDLSSYDSILQLGFNIPFYGDHVSLFALLMTISTAIYTYTNNQITPSDPNMAAMKWMMYLMPIIFLGVMNSSSSGLSYYYFIANLITIGQQYAMRKLVDENAIIAKIQENKKKPVTKSKFQQRLEEMAKQRGIQLPNEPKKK